MNRSEKRNDLLYWNALKESIIISNPGFVRGKGFSFRAYRVIAISLSLSPSFNARILTGGESTLKKSPMYQAALSLFSGSLFFSFYLISFRSSPFSHLPSWSSPVFAFKETKIRHFSRKCVFVPLTTHFPTAIACFDPIEEKWLADTTREEETQYRLRHIDRYSTVYTCKNDGKENGEKKTWVFLFADPFLRGQKGKMGYSLA